MTPDRICARRMARVDVDHDSRIVVGRALVSALMWTMRVEVPLSPGTPLIGGSVDVGGRPNSPRLPLSDRSALLLTAPDRRVRRVCRGPAGGIVNVVDAGQEPLDVGSEDPTFMFPAMADGETIEMPWSSMPDDTFLQDALAVTDPTRRRRVDERTWKLAIGAAVLVALGSVVVGVLGYLIPTGGAKPTSPGAAGSSPVTAGPPIGDGITPAPSIAPPDGTLTTDPSAGRTVDPSRTTSPPGVPSSTPAGSSLRTFSSAGGTIVAGCSGSDAHLASWHTAADYRVKSVTPGPTVQAAVTFKAQGVEITMTVSCTSGNPIVTTSSKFT
jgi:hypothetical protein